MKENRLYLLLLVVSLIVPWASLVVYFLHGGTLLTIVPDVFANFASSAVLLDALCTALVFWVFAFFDSERIGMKFHLYLVPLTLCVGLGVAMALYLIQRNKHLAPAS